MRDELVRAAIRLLDRDGPESLQARRITAAAGVSTMAVYTHFGGIHALLDEVARETFAQFGSALGAVAMTDDPIADVFGLAAAYREYAMANPRRYCLIFGLTVRNTGPRQAICTFAESASFHAIGAGAFGHISAVVERMTVGGHIRRDPPDQVALRLWALLHGVVLLDLAGAVRFDVPGATSILEPATIDLLVGMGANRSQVECAARMTYRK